MTAKILIRMVFLCGVLCSVFPALSATRSISPKEALQFSKTTTYLVMTGDDMISDAYLKEALAKTWNITPTKVIDLKKFEALKTDTMCSFLMTNTVIHPKSSDQKYIYLSLLLGSAQAQTMGDLPEVASIPFGCINSEKEPKYYLMSSLLRFLQQHAIRMQAKSFWGFFKLNFDRRLTYYNRFNKELKGKTIYIDTSDLEKSITKEYLLLTFGKRVVPTSEKELLKISAQKNDSILIGYCVPSFNIILAPSTGNLYYFNGKPGKNSERFEMTDMRVLYNNMRERKDFLTN